MYKKRGDKEFILDMFLACQKIIEYTKDIDFNGFEKDSKTVDAVIRNIEILGEAVKNISKDFRDKYKDIEWNIIAKTRDKLIHFYFGVDIPTVWKTAKIDIPSLFEELKNIIEKESWEDEVET